MTSPQRDYTRLTIGAPVPRFSLPSSPEGRGSLRHYLGRHQTLLVFQGRYFIGDTPSVGSLFARAAMTLCALSADADRFEAANTRVLAIAREAPASLQWLAGHLQLRFPLLSDADGDVGQAYGLLPQNRWAGSSEGYDETCAVMLVDRQGTLCWSASTDLIVSPRASVPAEHVEEWTRREPLRFGAADVLETEAVLAVADFRRPLP